jgi:hypothetical protein
MPPKSCGNPFVVSNMYRNVERVSKLTIKPYSLVAGINSKPAIIISPKIKAHTQNVDMLLVSGKNRKKFLRLSIPR